tara:strand:+ start:6303 stop:7004 length:702 start_codon:yes stop_codon:yes gene_type:complete
MRKPDLIIDSNERGSLYESVKKKASKVGLNINHQPLVVGDYLLGAACVEAKSVTDLIQSAYSGHLWRQLENLDANYQRFFVVVHGSIAQHIKLIKQRTGKTLPVSKIHSNFLGILARIMSDFECQVFYTPQLSEAATFIVKLHDKLHKPASRHGALAIRRVSTNDVRLDLLLSIPGIGRELAERLLETCGSIEEMMYPEALKKVKGLGDKRRQLIIEVLTKEEPVHIQRQVKR